MVVCGHGMAVIDICLPGRPLADESECDEAFVPECAEYFAGQNICAGICDQNAIESLCNEGGGNE